MHFHTVSSQREQDRFINCMWSHFPSSCWLPLEAFTFNSRLTLNGHYSPSPLLYEWVNRPRAVKIFAWSHTAGQNLFTPHQLEKILILKHASFHWKLHGICRNTIFVIIHSLENLVTSACRITTYLWELKRHLSFLMANSYHHFCWNSNRFTFRTSFGIKTYFLNILSLHLRSFKHVYRNKKTSVYLLDLSPPSFVFQSCPSKRSYSFWPSATNWSHLEKTCTGFSISEDLW